LPAGFILLLYTGPSVDHPLIEIKELECVRDHTPLFSNLNFKAETGTITQIGGENGSGKTSLLRILTGLAPAESGQVLWRGKPIQKRRADYAEALTFIGHLPGIKAQLSPLVNLCWLAPSAGRPDYFQALAEVGLRGYEDSPCYTLSAGQKRRVALARLYLEQRQVWILDEPFTAIDKKGVEKLEALLVLHAEKGGVVILTTHHELKVGAASFQQVLLGWPKASLANYGL
jgi:heme exporter protein A